MALYVLSGKDLMTNVENSIVRTFTRFPKHDSSLYGMAVGTGVLLPWMFAFDISDS